MNILIMMKSTMSYNRIKKDLNQYVVYEHITKYEELQNLLIYKDVDILITEIMLEDYERIKDLCYRNEITIIEYKSSFNDVVQQVHDFSVFYEATSNEVVEETVEHDFSAYEQLINQKINKPTEQEPKEQESITESEQIPDKQERQEVTEQEPTYQEGTLSESEQTQEPQERQEEAQYEPGHQESITESQQASDHQESQEEVQHKPKHQENINQSHLETAHQENEKKSHQASTEQDTNEQNDKKKRFSGLQSLLQQRSQKLSPFTEYDDGIDDFELDLERSTQKKNQVVYKTIVPKTIIVGSLWNGAGSTQFGLSLARALALRNIPVAYIEYPSSQQQPYMFDYLNLSQKEEDEGFTYMGSNYDRINKHIGYSYKGIQFVVNDSRKVITETKDFEHMYRLLLALREYPINIIDISNIWLEQEVQQLLYQADHIFLCVEKDPSKIDQLTPLEDTSASRQRQAFKIKKLLDDIKQTDRINYRFVTMKDAKVVDRETWDSLLLDEITNMPYVPYETVMKHIWNSQFVYDDPQYHEKLDHALQPILENLVPKEMNKRNKSSLFQKIFRS